MSLKYINNNGEEIIIAGKGVKGNDGDDGVPTGVILQYKGDEIPEGFEEVEISGLNQSIVLYENLNGTQESTITLANNLVKYEFIDIEFKTTRIADGLEHNYYFTERVYSPNGKYMQGHIHCTGNNDKMHDMIKELYFNGKTITIIANYYELRVGNNFSVRNTSDYLAITKIVGHNPNNLFIFTINGSNYIAEKGMSWYEWANSKYNTDGYICSSVTDTIKINTDLYIYYEDDTTQCKGAEIIIEDYDYTKASTGGAIPDKV